mmetsp:Transcript_9571/g.30624  ORF Transcript_9571/g.30624 Transcript_9571/m.30624 type:complete len:303 (-) Transcript_9571:1383-2291(-)
MAKTEGGSPSLRSFARAGDSGDEGEARIGGGGGGREAGVVRGRGVLVEVDDGKNAALGEGGGDVVVVVALRGESADEAGGSPGEGVLEVEDVGGVVAHHELVVEVVVAVVRELEWAVRVGVDVAVELVVGRDDEGRGERLGLEGAARGVVEGPEEGAGARVVRVVVVVVVDAGDDGPAAVDDERRARGSQDGLARVGVEVEAGTREPAVDSDLLVVGVAGAEGGVQGVGEEGDAGVEARGVGGREVGEGREFDGAVPEVELVDAVGEAEVVVRVEGADVDDLAAAELVDGAEEGVGEVPVSR